MTLYRTWRGPHEARRDGACRDGACRDGANNATARASRWCVKERYRTMRGYKHQASVLTVSRLIAWAGNVLDAGGADPAAVIA